MIDPKELRNDAEAAHSGHTPLEASASEVLELLDRLEEAEKAWKISDQTVYNLTEKVIPNIQEKLEAAEKDITLKEKLIDALGSELNAVANERDALRAELTQLHKEADKFEDGIDWIQRALQAEAQIEQMERQEPVAWMNSRNGFICKENKNPDYNVPLKRLDLGAQTQGEEK